jgi:HlyD family secretion protein
MPANRITYEEENLLNEPDRLSSGAIQELVSNKPGFLVSWGNSLLLAILVLIISASYFIKYPDTITTRARLSTLNAPKPVIALIEGKLVGLHVKEGDNIKAGEIIGFLESTGSHADVIKLQMQVNHLYDQLLSQQTVGPELLQFPQDYILGELQRPYQVFMQALLTYKDYVPGGLISRKRTMLQHDISYLRDLDSNLRKQKSIDEQDLSLQAWDMEMNEKLLKEHVISEQEYKQAKSRLLNKQKTIPQNNASLVNNQTIQNSKAKEIIELDNMLSQQKAIFLQAISTLKTSIDEWIKKYVLAAPVAGTIQFNGFVQVNQHIQQHQLICNIQGERDSFYVALLIPQTNFGKVHTGQVVLLKFNAFPFEEYGSVRGHIQYISPTPTDSGFLAKVICKNGLLTNYGKELPFNEGLTANADIITEDKNLLERLYYNISAKMKR